VGTKVLAGEGCGMKILDLLHFSCFRDSRDVKVLRHKGREYDLWGLVRAGEFEKYQCVQSWDVP
jgi:hypothetical protein